MVNIYIQGQLIDQFDDENVEVVSRVLDVNDITKTQGDYSKTFTVPASKTNNKIFKHWYNASIDSGFDARTKVDGNIDIDGVPFKKGKFLLRSAQIDDGIITSYTINFFGNVTSLKDIIGDDELTDLDFTYYDHSYTDSDVLDKFKVDYSDRYPAVIYTTMGKRRYFFQSDLTAEEDAVFDNYADAVTSQVDSNIYNIAYPSGGIIDEGDGDEPDNEAIGLQWTDMLPSLRCDTIIDAIEAKYPDVSFSRDFFGTTEFNQLYMLLSSESDTPVMNPKTTSQDIIPYLNFAGRGLESTDLKCTGHNGANVISTSTDESSITLESGHGFHTKMKCARTTSVGRSAVTVRLQIKEGSADWKFVQESNGVAEKNNVGVGHLDYQTDWFKYENTTDSAITLKTRYFVDVQGAVDVHCERQYKHTRYISFGVYDFAPTKAYAYSIASSGGDLGIGLNLPKIKIIDFLKGVFQMFKLVIVPQEDGTMYVNTLNSYYSQGTNYDISKYVDRGSLEVSRGDIISSLDFKFKESDTILASEFANRNKRGYGDAKVRLSDSNGEALEGESLEIELPFEQVIYERLTDITDDGELSYLQTAHLVDREMNPTSVGVVLHYANFKSLYGKPILAKTNTGNGFEEVDDTVYIPAHAPSFQEPFTSLLFEQELSTWDGVLIENTLYTNYYENYISAVFDIGRRTYKYTAKLPVIVSANLGLNDVITIDGYRYRINTYKYNMLTGISELELVNKLDTSLAAFNGAPPVLSVGSSGGTFSFNVPNIDEYTITETNLGDGTNWTAASTSSETSRGVERHNTLKITVDANTGTNGSFRRVKINFTLNSVTTTMIILQEDER